MPHHRTAKILLTAAFSLLGGYLIFIATSLYGPGVSSDSVNYLAAAQDFSRGEGVFPTDSKPLLNWPPFYPFLLGAIRMFFEIELLDIGRIVNIATFAGIILLGGILARRSLGKGLYWHVFALLAITFSFPVIKLATMIGADSLFILLVLLFILTGQNHLQKRDRKTLLFMALVASIAPLVRWTGVTLVIAGAAFMIAINLPNVASGLKQSAVFGAIASLPFVLWVVGRNYLFYGQFLASPSTTDIFIFRNIALSFERIIHWFVPYSLTGRIPAILIFAVLILAVAFLIPKARWRSYFLRLTNDTNLILVLFMAVYFLFIFMTTFTPDHLVVTDDRYQAPLYIPIIILLLVGVQELLDFQPGSDNPKNPRFIFAGFVLLLWLGLPVVRVSKYLEVSINENIPIYNTYNTKAYQESGLFQYLQLYDFDEEIPIYSNAAEPAYFHLDRSISSSPADPTARRRPSFEYLVEHYAGWPDSGSAYLIWIEGHFANNYYSPKMLSNIMRVVPLFETNDGGLYRVYSPSSAN